MKDEPTLLAALIGWFPLFLILVVWFFYMRWMTRRYGASAEIGKANTEAVRENTAVLKAILAKLEERDRK